MYGADDVSYYYELTSRLLRRKDLNLTLTEIEHLVPYEIDMYIEQMNMLLQEELGNNVNKIHDITEEEMKNGFK
jgi:hypothetical protein